MIKNYKITVDGKSYDVEVEDIVFAPAKNKAPSTASSIPVPVLTVEQKPEKSDTAVSAPAAKTSLPTGDIKGESLRAPMPGTILSVTTSVGAVVKRGDILLVLEAMKMENEIVAHIDGTISGVYVQKGSTVNAGDALVTFA